MKNANFLWILQAALVLCAPAAGAETYTLDAYYPSPAGVYTDLTVTSTTVLGKHGGLVRIGTAAKHASLEVSGSAGVGGDLGAGGVVIPGRLAADPAAPEQNVNGAIYFNTVSKVHRVHRDGAWYDLGGSAMAWVKPCATAGHKVFTVAYGDSYVYWAAGPDHSPEKICSDAGYSAYTGSCRVDISGGAKGHGSLLSNSTAGYWTMSCTYGLGAANFNAISEILCLK
jgi:hypothetical protein